MDIFLVLLNCKSCMPFLCESHILKPLTECEKKSICFDGANAVLITTVWKRHNSYFIPFLLLIILFSKCLFNTVIFSKNSQWGFGLTLSLLAVNFEDCWWPMQTIWIQMKPHKMWGFIWDPNCLTFRLCIGIKYWFETKIFCKF